MLARMSDPVLPVHATTGDARHRDVREQVFAVVPQRRPSLGRRIFWSVVLFVARSPAGLRLLQRLRGS
jgi:hypothetical protein